MSHDGRENEPGGRTSPSWGSYRRSIGDRTSLFGALRTEWAPMKALYPGSYLDLSPSTAIPSVTYVDLDRRAARYFAEESIVRAEIEGRTQPGAGTDIAFHHADYTKPLPIPLANFDLLISLYAGPVWDHCRQYLAPGGLLLANTSHGDASLAALDPSLQLVAAVHHRAGVYRLDTSDLDRYLIAKRPTAPDADAIRRQGRGIAYTKTAFAYVFRAVEDHR
ncbi:class I SAM-dependent methyltransferase [Homoserinibacter sp. GY 40078]|uniref:class I SAM-dependent methyltransferase n=1 Tax=Homoserinibacter sp. GY 40078 TaxID=2603275 RepID=UPI0011CB4DBE|nr:class I SAM-dependent methyltransferase [Homoserinibacter sp. GY 40078]TXK19689.1 class I SAM-dependent methyltransferase [Homoserinibacter sp. GY 40078]